MEKKPFLTEAQAQEILQDVPTPFHVYDEKGIRENARKLKALRLEPGLQGVFRRQGRCPTRPSCRSCRRRAAVRTAPP